MTRYHRLNTLQYDMIEEFNVDCMLSRSKNYLFLYAKGSSQSFFSSIAFLVPFGLPSRILNLYLTEWVLAFVCFSFFVFFVACARLDYNANSNWTSYCGLQTTGAANVRRITC